MNSTFEYNLSLFKKAVAMEPVDRVPFIPCAPAFFPLDGGISLKTAITDFETASKVNLAEHLKYKATGTQANIFTPLLLTGYWLSQVCLPGEGKLNDYDLWQMMEKEDFVSQDDYREIIKNGYGPWYEKFKKERLNNVDEKLIPYFQAAGPSAMEFVEAGIPITMGMLMITPFEFLCGGRSLQSFLLDDIYEEPELLKEVFDKIMEWAVPYYDSMLTMLKPLGVWVGGWRAAPGIVSPAICEEWGMPYIRKYVDMCIAHDVVPILHLDSDWEKALEMFRDFPEKKCILALDGKTDIFKAKEVLGDRMCIMGDVPAEMLAFSDYDTVYSYCEKLIREIGPTGFILASGCDVPPNAKQECVMAMGDAAEQIRP